MDPKILSLGSSSGFHSHSFWMRCNKLAQFQKVDLMPLSPASALPRRTREEHVTQSWRTLRGSRVPLGTRWLWAWPRTSHPTFVTVHVCKVAASSAPLWSGKALPTLPHFPSYCHSPSTARGQLCHPTRCPALLALAASAGVKNSCQAIIAVDTYSPAAEQNKLMLTHCFSASSTALPKKPVVIKEHLKSIFSLTVLVTLSFRLYQVSALKPRSKTPSLQQRDSENSQLIFCNWEVSCSFKSLLLFCPKEKNVTRGTGVFQSPLCQPSRWGELQLPAPGGNECWYLTAAGHAPSSLRSFISLATDTSSLRSESAAELGFPTARGAQASGKNHFKGKVC